MPSASPSRTRHRRRKRPATKQSLRALDWLNFFKADAQTTIGPYLAIFLSAVRGWDASRIGIAMSVPGVVAIVAQTPMGAVVDWAARKRLLVVLSAIGLAVGSLILVAAESLAIVTLGQTVVAVASIVIPPAIASVSVGLVGHRGFARRMGRNEAFSHGGALAAAVAVGAIAYWVSKEGIFYFAAAMSVAAAAVTLAIREDDIDRVLAREGAEEVEGKVLAASLRDLTRNRRIPIFVGAVILFHFANGAMLPLVGEMLSGGNKSTATPYMSACIITSQLVMMPIAVVAGNLSDSWGRRPIFLIGYAALPVRGLLFAFVRNPYALVAIQILDGVGAGIFGVVSLIVASDLAHGTGRFNLLQGAINTCVAIGAALSNLLGGAIATRAGFRPAFLALTAIACAALVFFWLAMPETNGKEDDD